MKVLVISPGQTLVVIAQQEGLDWRTIADFNSGLEPPYRLIPNSKLLIPEKGDLKPTPTLVFGQVIDARNKLLKLEIGSFKSENEVLNQETVYQPNDPQIARANWLMSAESILNTLKKRKAQRKGLSSSINWTNIGQ